jgi:hypothetical protein
MRIGGSSKGTFGHGGEPSADPRPAAARASRALTVIAAPAPRDPSLPRARGDSAFLAHLIATKAQAPQTREKRRAAPAEVLAAYRAVANLKF